MSTFRLSLDLRYPGIIAEARAAIDAVSGRAAGSCRTNTECVEVYSDWKHWPCLFPQHCPGVRHLREIALVGPKR